jgi:hypothetical protein
MQRWALEGQMKRVASRSCIMEQHKHEAVKLAGKEGLSGGRRQPRGQCRGAELLLGRRAAARGLRLLNPSTLQLVFLDAVAQRLTRGTEQACSSRHIVIGPLQGFADDVAVHVVEGHAAVQRQP